MRFLLERNVRGNPSRRIVRSPSTHATVAGRVRRHDEQNVVRRISRAPLFKGRPQEITMKRIVLCSLVVASVCASAGYTFAGRALKTQVKIGVSPGGLPQAEGALRAVRASTDSRQFISCELVAFKGGESFVSCFARDKNGKQLSCIGDDDNLAFAVAAASMNTSTHLYFDLESETSTECRLIQTANDSSYL
jgi:hypothetical protein